MNWTNCGTTDVKYKEILELYVEKITKGEGTDLEHEMFHLLNNQARRINELTADTTTLRSIIRNLEEENCFLMRVIQEDEQGVGDSMISVAKD